MVFFRNPLRTIQLEVLNMFPYQDTSQKADLGALNK